MPSRFHRFFKQHTAGSMALSVAGFIFIEGLFSFCSKKCPAFSDALFDSWFPYQKGQRFYFTSSAGGRDTITIREVYKSEKRTTGFLEGSCSTGADITADNAITGRPKLNISYTKDDLHAYGRINVFELQVYGATVMEQRIDVQPPFISRSLPHMVINGKTFSDVAELQIDTMVYKSEGIYKAWFLKGVGLVGYEHYPSLEQWAKE